MVRVQINYHKDRYEFAHWELHILTRLLNIYKCEVSSTAPHLTLLDKRTVYAFSILTAVTFVPGITEILQIELSVRILTADSAKWKLIQTIPGVIR